jgi:FG-GAP-like repeat
MRPPIFLILLASLVGGNIASGQTVSANSPRVVGAFTTYGNHIGESGIVASTEPGLHELFLDGLSEGSFWHAIRYEASGGTYVQTYSSPFYSSDIRHLAVADVHPAPGDEIIVVLQNGDIFLYHQSTKVLLISFATGVDQVTAFGHYDLDGDGTHEVALIGSGGLSIYTSTGALYGNYPSLLGSDLAIGQMDADPSPEVAVTNGSVLDVASGVVQSTWSLGFGFELELTDFDNDGMEELIIAEAGNYIWAFDVDIELPKWSLAVEQIDTIAIGDSDLDGVDELILGEKSWGDVISYDLTTQAQNWKIDNPEFGITSLLVADVDNDGAAEVVWGSGANSTGPDFLHVGNPATETIEWVSLDYFGPFTDPLLGDVDGDGIAEVVFASLQADAGFIAHSGRIVVLDQANNVPFVSPDSQRGDEIHNLRLIDVDGDGDQEILVAWGTPNDGLIEIYDFSLGGIFTKIWDSNVFIDGAPFYSVDACDLDGDGTIEIIGGGGSVATNTDGTFVYVYDFASGNQKWHTVHMGALWDHVTEIDHGDFDGDGQLEIAAMLENGSVYIFANDSTLEAIISGNFHSMRLGSIDGRQRQGLLLGNKHGAIKAYRWNGASYQTEAIVSLASDPIDGFTLLNSSRVLASIAGKLNLFRLPTALPMWQSDFFGSRFGSRVFQLNNDDYMTGGFNGVYTFGIR